MNKEQLQELVSQGLSSYKIAKLLSKSPTAIRYWINKFQIKHKTRILPFEINGIKYKKCPRCGQIKEYNSENFHHRKNELLRTECKDCIKIRPFSSKKLEEYNWKEIQAFYDDTHSYRETSQKFCISQSNLSNAKKIGLFKPRTFSETWLMRNPDRKGSKHTEESKQKLRQARLDYLAAHPDSPSWKQNNKKYSIPCEKVKRELKEMNIPFEEEFQPLLHIKRFFSIDISFPDKKIGVEINGGQHYDTNHNLKPYYQNRHNLIEQDGWKLYEFPYYTAMRSDFVQSKILPILNPTPGQT